ncbi:MAG: hypothetical protein MK078_12280 [Crocinitomicaceae bacterium]|nr:hypothetical protein [Crocinitomicaceae bacterium]
MRNIFLFFLVTLFGGQSNAQDSLLQLKTAVSLSFEANQGVQYGRRYNTLSDQSDIINGRSYGVNLGYHTLFHLNTYNRLGFGVELTAASIQSQINFRNAYNVPNPTGQYYDLGKINSFYLATDLPLYYQNAMRFKTGELALSLGTKIRIIPFIGNAGNQSREFEVDYDDANYNFNNVFNVDYGMELSRVVVFYNLRVNYTRFLENSRGLSFFTSVSVGGFNNWIDVYYSNMDNYENGTFYEYEGESRLYLKLAMSHLSFGVSYLW